MEQEQQDVGPTGDDGQAASLATEPTEGLRSAQPATATAAAAAPVKFTEVPPQLQQDRLLQQQQPALHQASIATGQAGAPGAAEAPLSAQQLQHLQQQHASWAASWPEISSSGSGSSSGLLAAVTAGLPAADVPGELPTSEAVGSRAWQAQPRLRDSRGGSPLDLLGRTGLGVAQQQMPRHTPPAGMPSTGMRYSALSLPASPTMLQHQLQQQHQQQLLPQLQPQQGRGHFSISPGSATWPDMEMEQAPAPAAAAAIGGENGENGESLLWPGGALLPASSSPNLLQPGMPLGLRLRSTAGQQQRQEGATIQQAGAILQQSCQPPTVPTLQQSYSSSATAAGLSMYGTHWGLGRATPEQLLQDQQLMPPPLPPQGLGAAGAAVGRSGIRPPPLIIPSTQPQQQPQQQQQHMPAQQQVTSGPKFSPAPPASGTTVTPAMLSMTLAETPGASSGATSTGRAALALGQPDVEGSSGSGRPRRPRRRTSLPSSPAVAGVAPAAPTGAAAVLSAGRRYLQVVCGNTSGWLDVTDMLIYVQGSEQEEAKVTPANFEALAGKASTRKWRQSLTVVPLGPDDHIVPEPITIGDFMKQYQLDRPPSAANQLGRVGSSSLGTWDEGVVSPGRHQALVSPGMRRRRQLSQPSSQESLEQAAAEAAAGEEQLATHAKRSRSAAARTTSEQQQPQPSEQTWQQLVAPDLQTAAPAAAVPSVALVRHHNLLHVQQPGPSVQPDESQAAVAGERPAAAAVSPQQHPLPRPYSTEQPQLHTFPGFEAHPGQQVGQQHWRPYSPQPLGYSADIAAAGLEAEYPSVLPPEHGVVRQQRRRRQQPGGYGDQAELLGAAATSQQQQQQGAAADVPARSAAAAGQLLSPSGRPIRQPASRRAAASLSSAAGRYERGSQLMAFRGGIRQLQVWCDQLPGILDLYKMQVVPQEGQCEGQPMSLSAFEQLGGRGTARKWRRSLTTTDGDEVISLGEWLERYQITPGSEKHVSPKISPKPRGTSPAAAAPGLAGPLASPHVWPARDQQGGKSAEQRQQLAMPPIHPGALSIQPTALSSAQQRAGSAGTPQGPDSVWQAAAAIGRESSSGGDVRRHSHDTGPAGDAQQWYASASAADPVNPELLMMLTEYASDFNHPEWGLHAAQVEQDLADITALSAGAAGMLSPRLADWQQQQQQQQIPGAAQQSSTLAARGAVEPSLQVEDVATAAVPGQQPVAGFTSKFTSPKLWQHQETAGGREPFMPQESLAPTSPGHGPEAAASAAEGSEAGSSIRTTPQAKDPQGRAGPYPGDSSVGGGHPQ